MNKLFHFSALLIMVISLSACADSNEKQTSAEPKEESKPAEQKEVSNEPKEPETQENGKVVFTEVGQKGKVEMGTLELLKIKDINQTIDVAPIKVTIKDIKLFKLTEISSDYKEMLDQYNDGTPVGDEITYVQIMYDGENLEDKNIGWNSLSNVVTDKGQQIDVEMKDMIMTDADYDSAFLGKVKKEFTDGFIVKDSSLSKLKLIWGSSYDEDSYEDITPEQQNEISF